MSKIVAIANQKGGVGKTTTCVNLSSFLAFMGKNVLAVDVDPQGNASSGLGIDKNKLKNSIYTLMCGECSANDAIQKTTVPHLSIIPSHIGLVGAESELVNQPDRERVLKKTLSPLRNSFDYIFIDCPPSLGLLTVNAFTAADSILIPIQGEYFALEGLSQLMNTIRLAKQHLNPILEVEGVVLTMHDRSNLVNLVTTEILKFFGKKVFASRIPKNVRLAEAPSFGLPVMQYDPKSSGSLAYHALAEEFLKRNNDPYKKIPNLADLKVKI